MGIISVDKANNLFWLGRYTERVFTTLRKFFRVYDHMLDDSDQDNGNSILNYREYCGRLAIPDIYLNEQDFVTRYLFDRDNPDSLVSNMERAYDDAIVLRDEVSSHVLGYIQLALDTFDGAKNANMPIFALQPVIDDLFAFWGCVDDYVENEECRNIIKTGKYLERLDLYLRLDYRMQDIEKEYSKMLNRLNKTKLHINMEKLEELTAIINKKTELTENYREALNCLGEIVEVI
ncbi:MAG: alpha-E domain-containing protein [Lachnospiraceae bacterium]|nr:alpha-E domain-containing protein [Lachnospiraceae bacterium]